MNQLLFFGLMLLIALCPLPLGSNREWSWSLCAVAASLLAVLWSAVNLGKRGQATRLPWPVLGALFTAAVAWIVLQIVPWMPMGWVHPLWGMAEEVLGPDVRGIISLAAEDTGIALMRLLTYALVFVLAFQLGRDAARARAAFTWMAVVGVIYAIAGLSIYWSGEDPQWLFGGQALLHDVRGTFVNRNHFATWVGLTILCAIARSYQALSVPVVKPYSVPQDRPARVEEFILRAWKPMTGLLLMVTALVLTHSRGGFVSTLVAAVILWLILDRRGAARRALSRASVAAAILIASISFYLTSEVLLDRINRTDITSEERLAVFADVGRGIADNSVLGFGYGTFADSFRLYDRNESLVHYDRAHNTWLENAFELGIPAASALFLSIAGFALICIRGLRRRHRDWVYPAAGASASVLVGLHATVDFSLQIPAVAMLYACILGIAVAQSFSSVPQAVRALRDPGRRYG